MNKRMFTGLICGFLMFSALKAETIRELDFNFNWKFSLNLKGDAFAPKIMDADWQDVQLPHDWSVAFPFDSIHGEGCTGYLPGGLGWYRKHFSVNINADQLVYILFDGVYNNSEVWLNGKKLGGHPYGYTPFYFNLTPYLNSNGKDNVIAVKVDHTRFADSRWYTGSGIYRNVKLITVNKLHIPIWGTRISTPEVTNQKANVQIEVSVENAFKSSQQFSIVTEVYNPKGDKVSETVSESQTSARGSAKIMQNIVVDNPALWGVRSPYLYKAVTKILVSNKIADRYETIFGIRSIRFDSESGFFLNGENMKIKGVCLHHDGGLVGSAVPKGVWKRRLQILKNGGCNAIRTSHNPPSDEFLQLCDEMGFLVQDEFFDEWDNPKDKRLNMQEQHNDYITRGYAEHFQQWAESDLKTTILAHRNHPSVFQWSIGNEIEWTYPGNREATGFFDNMDWSGNYFWSVTPYSREKIRETYLAFDKGKYQIGTTAKKLGAWTRELDTTRPVVANCILPSASFETGYTDALDIVGFSYRRVMYDYAKKNYPDKVVMGTENLGQWHEWKAVIERPFVSGMFIWTGIDYMGESNNHWPEKSTTSGLLDAAGFEKPSYHMFKALWQNEPSIYLCSNKAEVSKYKVDESGKVVEKKPGGWENALWTWYSVNEHWNYKNGEPIIAEVVSNCESVELFLNNKSLGVKLLSEFPDRIYKWAVPFHSGTLKARGVKSNGLIETQILSSGEPTSVRLTVDKTELSADGYDVAHVVAQVVDENNVPVQTKETMLTFGITGNAKMLGVDNGDAKSTQQYQSNSVVTSHGRALLIVQSTKKTGTVTVSAVGNGLKTAVIELVSK